jgi:4-alpha-glucanotransferase
MLTLFDGVRIDHFRGLEAYWSIPANAATAKEGHWEKGPRNPFVKQLHKVVSECEEKLGYRPLIVAEDLGESTPELEKFVKDSGFPGMRVLQFAFDGDPENTHLPHNYVANTVAYTGTHDNNTLLGFIWDADESTRRDMLNYCGYTEWNWDRSESYDAVMRTLLRSVADLAILPIQDILGFGGDCRMNTPGEGEGNWAFRVTTEQMAAIDRGRFLAMNRLYGRAPEAEEKN